MTKPFPLIDVAGTHFECGEQHGRQAGERIARGLDIYRADFERRGTVWSEALATAREYGKRIEAFSAEAWEEVRGIARGSEQPVEAVTLLNARTELTFSRPGLMPVDVDGCTAVLALPTVTAEGHLLHAQNWDWQPECVDTSIVLRVTPHEGPRMLLFCEAGQLARHGFNSAGIALTANGLASDVDYNKAGVPTPLVRRQMFAKSSYSEAIGVLLNAERSFSHSIIVSHRDGEAICLETTPESVYWLEAEQGILTHANHFKHPAACHELKDLSLARHPESLHRDGRAHRFLHEAGGEITIDTIKSVLADRFDSPNAICRSPAYRPDGSYSATVASLIMDSTAGRMWLAAAPYDECVYEEYRL